MSDFLITRMEGAGDEVAVAMPDRSCTYRDLLVRVRAWQAEVGSLPPGSVVSSEGDYGPESIAVFLALTLEHHVVVPLSPDSRAHHASFLDIAAVEYRVRLDSQESPAIRVDH